VALNVSSLDRETLDNTLTVLLKHEADVIRTRQAVGRGLGDGSEREADDLDASRLRWRYR
jgi:hypothetical protein